MQADDRLHQIVFQHITTDFAFAGAPSAGEQGRAIQHDAKAAAAILSGAHLANQVQQKQQRAITHPRQARAKRPA